MSRIGVVTVTMVGSNICTNHIVAEALKNNVSGKHPEIVSIALSFDRYKSAIVAKNWNKVADLILETINLLQLAGCDFIIIPSNTPHYAFEKVHLKSSLPVFNLLEITAEECAKKGFKQVVIMGTKATMEDGLYTKALTLKNIKLVIPDVTTRELMDTLIMDYIIPSRPNHLLQNKIKSAILDLNCDAAILGCTELSEVYNSKTLEMPIIDTTRLLATTALKYSIKLDNSRI